MPYCHKCGKKHQKDDSFCGMCGAKIGEFIEEVGQEVKEFIGEKKKNGSGIKVLIFLLVFGYIILNIWAVSQLTPVFSAESVLTSASNLNGNVGLTQTTVSSTIRMENPTFVPILFTRISYEGYYGDTKFADGKTRFFAIAPNSQKDILVELKVYNLNAVSSLVKGLLNAITGQKERLYIDVYSDIGVAKFKLRTLE